ncbi:MAG: septation protein A [Gammaproteobacteria bacterium]|nr:MAG: septation protein A [Gammaproteobacteria bacterium]
MKQLIDFIPLILFFTAYKLGDIYLATKTLMVVTTLQYGFYWIKDRKLERFQIITLSAVYIFGTLTLVLHDETFLKWKAPMVNGLFAMIFLGSQFVGEQNLVKRMMGHAVDLPDNIWTHLNYSWVVFFLFSGSANLYVAFTYHEYWVDFKVFGSLGMTLLFMVGQTIYLAKYIKEPEEDGAETDPAKPSDDSPA